MACTVVGEDAAVEFFACGIGGSCGGFTFDDGLTHLGEFSLVLASLGIRTNHALNGFVDLGDDGKVETAQSILGFGDGLAKSFQALQIVLVRGVPFAVLALLLVGGGPGVPLLLDGVLHPCQVGLDELFDSLLPDPLQGGLVLNHLRDLLVVLGQHFEDLRNGLGIIDGGGVAAGGIVEFVELLECTRVVLGLDFLKHRRTDGVGLDVEAFRLGLFTGEPLAFELHAAGHDLFFFELSVGDHFFHFRGFLCAGVAVHEGTQPVLNELLVFFRRHQVRRGDGFPNFENLHFFRLLLEDAAFCDVGARDVLFIHDLRSQVITHPNGGGRLGENVAFQLFAVFEGHDVGVQKSGAAGKGKDDRLVAAQFHGNTGLDERRGMAGARQFARVTRNNSKPHRE